MGVWNVEIFNFRLQGIIDSNYERIKGCGGNKVGKSLKVA